jgi:broad specificity phosphatase PhoE
LRAVALLVVRHAHAGERSGWAGDDRLRPLSEKGRRQAAALVDVLSLHPVKRVLSSPAVRCISSVEPLARHFGLDVEVDERLGEGAGTDDVTSLLREVGDAALCSHGDVIPLILRQLTADGMRPAQGLRWSKASTWVVERTEAGWGAGAYVPAPAV